MTRLSKFVFLIAYKPRVRIFDACCLRPWVGVDVVHGGVVRWALPVCVIYVIYPQVLLPDVRTSVRLTARKELLVKFLAYSLVGVVWCLRFCLVAIALRWINRYTAVNLSSTLTVPTQTAANDWTFQTASPWKRHTPHASVVQYFTVQDATCNCK